ncbi:MAG: alpha-mannosidase [Lachnospiraceae bacterium]|jgi:alpha-mannosidase
MAHVKVVRRSMRPEEWTDLRFVWLQRGIYKEKVEIGDLEIRDARQVAENEYDFCYGGWRKLNRGDLYFTPDGTCFIRGRTHVPAQMKGQKIYFCLHTAAEMIVKINGKYAGGIDPNRERILLNPFLDSDDVQIEIEAYNRSKPDDERNPAASASRGCRQIFDGAYFATVRENVLSLVYDYTLFLDIAKCEYFNEDYRKFLDKELSKALDFVDFDTWEGVDEAADYVNRVIYANTDFHGSGNVAVVGHSHLDIAYYWRRIHAVQKNARTVLIQMRLMDQYPELRYTHTSAYTYETLEKYYPDLFAELKQKVASGQFEPVGAMYVEPDCNIPAAESLIRQCLYGQLYFRKTFGKTIDNAWLPDVFGNSWILPQILRKSGVDYFVSNKMSTWNDTNRFPHNNFIWKGIDGTEVYACVPPTHFISWNMPSQIQENWEAYQDKETGGQTLSMFGYGDGGSGVTEEMMEMYRRFDRVSVMPRVEMTGGSEFLRKNLKDNTRLAVWDGELYLEMHRGTFTTKSYLKKANRDLEYRLRETELLEALRSLRTGNYPAEEIRDIYKKVLLNQFHDILPGSHIHPVFEDAMKDYRDASDRLDALLAPFAENAPYFNSLNFDRTFITFIEDESGPVVRHGKHGFWCIPQIAGLTAGIPMDAPLTPGWLTASEDGNAVRIETPYYRIRLEAEGSFSSLYDLGLDREWVKEGRGFNRLHLYADHPGTYDAWDILPNYKDVEIPLTLRTPAHLTYSDDTSAEFTAVFATEKSTWKMIIRLFADSPAIEVENVVDWNEKHRLAKVNFGPDVLTREILCDTSAGYVSRSLTKNTTWEQARFECCHHKWFDLSENGGGVAVINEGKYGVGLEGDEVSLSLLRSTIRPDITSDMGSHDICYVILPHSGNAVEAGVNRAALEYNIPLRRADVRVPRVLADTLNDCGLYLQAMKRSEDGKKIVIRLSEQDGARGRLSFPFPVTEMNMLEDEGEETRTVSYKPFEILTLGIDPADLAE